MPKSIVLYFLKLRDRTTLGQQVAFVSAMLCLALVITVTTAVTYLARQQATTRVETAMVSVAGSMAERLDTRMFERFREIRIIAGLEPLRDLWQGAPEATRGVLEQLRSTLPEYAWIGLALPDGTVKAATGGMLEGVSVAERPWFKAGLAGPTVQDVHDAKLLAELLGPTADGEPFRFVDFAVPVADAAGQTTGVLGVHMSWSWAAAVREMVLQALDPNLRTDVWVLDGQGKALLGPDFGSQPLDAAAIAAIKANGRLSFTDNIDGGHMLGAVVASGHLDYPGLGWIVVARRPLALALAPANQLTLTIAMIGAAFAVLGVTAATLLSDRLTRPLKELADSIDRIGRDPGATMITRGHSSRDVFQLSVSIRSLLRRLGIAETAQEAAVREAALHKQLLAEKTQRLGEDINALQVLADTDPLTGLLNRRAFRVFGVDAMNYFQRHKRDVGVLVIDIDFFKRINDTYGHAVGDDVIQSVGKIVLAEARTIDKVARFGGEEFVVLMRETEKEGPAVLAERIREKIAGQLIDHPEHGTIHVTVSIGASMAIEGDRDIEDVVERADRALYEAKSLGRNRVAMAGLSEPERAAA
jgi:diguanylate cyclase (GGDEF)-like protein